MEKVTVEGKTWKTHTYVPIANPLNGWTPYNKCGGVVVKKKKKGKREEPKRKSRNSQSTYVVSTLGTLPFGGAP